MQLGMRALMKSQYPKRKKWELQEISPVSLIIEFASPVLTLLLLIRLKNVNVNINFRRDVKKVETVRFHSLESRKILEKTLQPKQIRQTRARLYSQRSSRS